MGDCRNPQTVRQFEKKDHIWKPLHPLPAIAGLFVIRAVARMLTQAVRGLLKFHEQIQPQTLAPVIIPRHSFSQFAFDGGMNPDPLHENLARSSSITFSTGSPLAFPLRISRERLSSSASNSCSVRAGGDGRDWIRKWARLARSAAERPASSVFSFSAVAVMVYF